MAMYQYPLNVTAVDLKSIRQYGIPTVIDFGWDSCVPCKQMAPVLETLHEERLGKAAVQSRLKIVAAAVRRMASQALRF